MAETNRQPLSDTLWPRLKTWLTEAISRARSRGETWPVQPEMWTHMAEAALAGDRVRLADCLSQRGETKADPLDAVAAQFETVLEVLSASNLRPDSELWRGLMMACQGAILAEEKAYTDFEVCRCDCRMLGI